MKRKYGRRLLKKLAALVFRKSPDRVALKLLTNICLANARPVAACIKLPKAKASDLAQYGRVVLRRMAVGKLSPDTARDVLGALAAQAQLVEHAEIVARLEQLEASAQRTHAVSPGGIPIRGSSHVQ